MADTRDVLERAHSLFEMKTGRAITTDEMAQDFVLHDPDTRIRSLHAVDQELSSDAIGWRRKAELLSFRRKLGDVHFALVKADR